MSSLLNYTFFFFVRLNTKSVEKLALA